MGAGPLNLMRGGGVGMRSRGCLLILSGVSSASATRLGMGSMMDSRFLPGRTPGRVANGRIKWDNQTLCLCCRDVVILRRSLGHA
jgi:hypothetical protein